MSASLFVSWIMIWYLQLITAFGMVDVLIAGAVSAFILSWIFSDQRWQAVKRRVISTSLGVAITLLSWNMQRSYSFHGIIQRGFPFGWWSEGGLPLSSQGPFVYWLMLLLDMAFWTALSFAVIKLILNRYLSIEIT